MFEPAADLSVAVTIVSSMAGMKIKAGTAFIGEIGLGGELRGVKNVDQRIAEAQKMGFSTVIVPNTGVRKGSSRKTKTTDTKEESSVSRFSTSGKANDPADDIDTGSVDMSPSSSSGVVKCSNLYQALTVALEVDSFSEIAQKLRGSRKQRSAPPSSQRAPSSPTSPSQASPSSSPYYSSPRYLDAADELEDGIGDTDDEIDNDDDEDEEGYENENYGDNFTGNMMDDDTGTMEGYESPHLSERSGTSGNVWQEGRDEAREAYEDTDIQGEGNDVKAKPPVKSRRSNSRYEGVGRSITPSGAVRSSSSSSSSSSANAGWRTIRKVDKNASPGSKYIVDDGQGGATELNSNSRKLN